MAKVKYSFECTDSCNLICHSRAEEQGVAAAVWGPEISALIFAKAVSAVNRCGTMEEQPFGLQPQDRQDDSSGQEAGECTMFSCVCVLVELLPVAR